MKIENEVKLDFSDVLLRPKRSELSSRNDVDVEREFVFPHSGQKWKGVPIIASNMDTTGTVAMARVFAKYKMIVCLHKFHVAEDIPADLDRNYYAVSTGIGKDDLANLADIIKKRDPFFICIDVANGYSKRFLDTVKEIRKMYPTKTLMAGNVVTREIVEELIIGCGVDIVKVGIGSGSVCTTRLQTGVGYPQFSAVAECADASHGVDGQIISDGGVQVVGDIAKAFGAGADFVMAGSMFSGHDESGGDLIEIEDDKKTKKQYKVFYGMSSKTAMDKYHGGVAKYRSAEGKKVRVLYKGAVEKTILNILGGLRSTMTYIGAKKLKNVPKCATFMRVNNQVNRLFG